MSEIVVKLKYGNTNSFLIRGIHGCLLVDTDMAGTLHGFYRVIKNCGIKMNDITYVLATHYHPDHMGLVSELMKQGVKLLLIDCQRAHVHDSDYIFARDKGLNYESIQADKATVITCEDSRAFLKGLGIAGEIISTPSHSADCVSLILDDGMCFVGDLEPMEYLDAYEENEQLTADWLQILEHNPREIHFAHMPARKI